MSQARAPIVERLTEFAKQHRLTIDIQRVENAVQASVYSRDKTYRYAFARCWRDQDPLWLWVGLNPGTGDTEQRRRPTLERCVAWSTGWAAGGLLIANLFGARSKTPKALRSMQDPTGPHNDAALSALSAMAESTVVAWGGRSTFVSNRARAVVPILKDPRCLGTTAGGQPRHPLYVASKTLLRPWRGHKLGTAGN